MIRLAAAESTAGASRKAFFNRWPTRDEFLPDALIYALVYDETEEDPEQHARQMPMQATEAAGAQSFSSVVLSISDGLLESLQRHPRSYLTLHIGPLLPQHPSLWQALMPSMKQGTQVWADGYAALVRDLDVTLRPEWTPQRLALALQATLDGFLLRYRIQPDDYPTSRWEGAGLFADTVLTLILGAIDSERSRTSGRAALDKLLSS